MSYDGFIVMSKAIPNNGELLYRSGRASFHALRFSYLFLASFRRKLFIPCKNQMT